MDKAKRLQTEIEKIFGDNPVNLVGGSVRDIILGLEPKDWDYCTPLQPDTIEQMVRDAGRKPYLTGKRFGTIGFKVPIMVQDFQPEPGDRFSDFHQEFVYVEVTTYRTEQYDGVSRKPEVNFTRDLLLDLSRRDFTINSIVLNAEQEYFDPHGGRLDILAKKIKAVGKGRDRIKEDPLRMLRAARFASRLNFDIDPNFIGVMRQMSSEITRVSKERWIIEMDKILDSEYPFKGLNALYQTDLLKYMLPELHQAFANGDTIVADIAAGVDGAQTLNEKWAKLLCLIGLPIARVEKGGVTKYTNHDIIRKELLLGICARLKFSNERTEYLLKWR